MKSIKNLNSKVALIIMDGLGSNPEDLKNALKHAHTPNLDYLFKTYPYTEIYASGVQVGLPEGVMGNSEVGHLNIGAGRPVRQDLVRINEAIQEKTIQDLPKLQELIQKAKEKGKVQLLGLLSDGGVHSHLDHIIALSNILSAKGIEVYFHAFMDGRDTQKDKGITYLKTLCEKTKIKIASIQGRSIGMDRDRRWEKIELAYKTMTGKGNISSLSPEEYIQEQYKQNTYDEFITPTLFDTKLKIEQDDVVFFINFRPDRARQITLAFTDPNFNEFSRDITPSYFLCMTPYVPEELPKLPVLFDKEPLPGGLCETLSSRSHKQYKSAETEKYAHVTYFFNGGKREPFPGEVRKLVNSPRDVKTYDEKPQMSAFEVCDHLLEALKDSSYSFYLVNFANPDMVGHTGNFEAAIKAVETVDECVGKIVQACEESKISLLLTADHGNCDQMIYPDGSPHTSHTTALVPFCLVDSRLKNEKIELSQTPHALKDIAPTILSILGEDIPSNFEGQPIWK